MITYDSYPQPPDLVHTGGGDNRWVGVKLADGRSVLIVPDSDGLWVAIVSGDTPVWHPVTMPFNDATHRPIGGRVIAMDASHVALTYSGRRSDFGHPDGPSYLVMLNLDTFVATTYDLIDLTGDHDHFQSSELMVRLPGGDLVTWATNGLFSLHTRAHRFQRWHYEGGGLLTLVDTVDYVTDDFQGGSGSDIGPGFLEVTPDGNLVLLDDSGYVYTMNATTLALANSGLPLEHTQDSSDPVWVWPMQNSELGLHLLVKGTQITCACYDSGDGYPTSNPIHLVTWDYLTGLQVSSRELVGSSPYGYGDGIVVANFWYGSQPAAIFLWEPASDFTIRIATADGAIDSIEVPLDTASLWLDPASTTLYVRTVLSGESDAASIWVFSLGNAAAGYLSSTVAFRTAR